MVLLLNLLLPLLLLVILLFGYVRLGKKKTYTEKVKTGALTLIAMIATILLYANIQPSYMPKGTVPNMSKVPITTNNEAIIQDRLLKPMSEENRQKRVDEILTVRDEVKDVLKKNEKPIE